MELENENIGTTQGTYVFSLATRLSGWFLLIGAFAVIVHYGASTVFQKGVLTLVFLIYLNSYEATLISPKDAEEEYNQGKLNDLDMRQAGIEAIVLAVFKFILLAYFVYISFLAINEI